MAQLPYVLNGDIWADNDPRGGPTFRVVKVCGGWPGDCQPLSLTAKKPHAHVENLHGSKRPRTVLLRRFRNDYRLVSPGPNTAHQGDAS